MRTRIKRMRRIWQTRRIQRTRRIQPIRWIWRIQRIRRIPLLSLKGFSVSFTLLLKVLYLLVSYPLSYT